MGFRPGLAEEGTASWALKDDKPRTERYFSSPHEQRRRSMVFWVGRGGAYSKCCGISKRGAPQRPQWSRPHAPSWGRGGHGAAGTGKGSSG